MYPRRHGSCSRRSLDIAEEVGIDDKVFPGGDSDGDARQKTNGNIKAFHTRFRRHGAVMPGSMLTLMSAIRIRKFGGLSR
jgi:hypothetical protein